MTFLFFFGPGSSVMASEIQRPIISDVVDRSTFRSGFPNSVIARVSRVPD